MATLPIFGAGNYENILKAISNNTISYPAWMYCRDQKKLGFVEKDGSFVLMKGDNKPQVVFSDKLPDPSEGDSEVLYIVGSNFYKFDGTLFVPLGEQGVIDVDELVSRIDALEVTSDETVNKVADLENEVGSINEQIVNLEEKLNSLEITEECKCGAEYEITDVPAGTLVNYRDGEIRIMCPVDAVFTKQAVGAGGDADCYYVTLKTYAPNDESIVGYIEHLGEQVDSEVLTDLKTDAKGRKYQPTWLAVAKYDEATDTWTYYGANSSKEKYIGWNYQIDWYNTDGVMVASDSVRINLSNEECHFVIEPYYMAAVKAEVEALKESNADVVEKLATVTEQVIEIEERVEVVEKETLTFIELE